MAASRVKSMAMRSGMALCLVLLVLPSCCRAFSAGLPRPWDAPGSGDGRNNGNNYNRYRGARRRRRTQRRRYLDATVTKKRHGLTTTYASLMNTNNSENDELAASKNNNEEQLDLAAFQDKDSDDESDDEERMVLEDAPRVFVAPSSTGSAAAAAAHSAASVASKGHGDEPKIPTVRSCLPQLFAMSRPSNYVGVVLLHMLGTHLGLRALTTGATATSHTLRSVLTNPQMILVLIALLLTSSTSMLVNDYYDARSGVDAGKSHKPMVNGSVPLPVVKRFCSYLYAGLLVCLTMIPGMVARLSIVTGAMLTFWYTQHLKPMTWIKNVTCATLIALSPFCSGAAALQLMSTDPWSIFQVATLWRLFSMLLFGFVGREMLMDVNDVVEDRRHKVRTVPAKYGRLFAARVAFCCTIVMAALSLVGRTSMKRGQIALASIGSAAQLYRALNVVRTGGEDEQVTERAIEEGKHTVLFLLASYI